ncbi:hypothetical protein KR093_000974 [Drosophila rubida]|uniref:Uncharacterized protein n=1 Tax=Drosophila rubida TaxID=30044 RepID=A0AAD4K9N0_9MUSC|nr:hypothetical protein KR093_000974 [Drosophila rubida]
MSNDTFPRVLGYIAKLCTSDEDIRKVFVKLENALQAGETLRKSKNSLKKDINNMRIDMVLIRQAALIAEEQREENSKSLQILDNCYSHLLKIVGFVCDDRVNNILRFSILNKQHEMQKELDEIQQQQTKDLECKVALENRRIVKEFRKWQQVLKEAEEESQSLELELQQLDEHWKIKIDRATQQRNKKIVSLVQLSKEIADMQTFKIPKPFGSKIAKSGIVSVVRSTPVKLQSAMEFLRKFQLEPKVSKAIQLPLRPILVNHRSQEDADNVQPSPAKQVHFADLPSPVRMEENNSSQMSFEMKIQKMKVNDEDDDDDGDGDGEDEGEGDVDVASARPESDRSHISERAIIENVEILPPLKFYSENDEASNVSVANNPSKSMETLSFKNLFSPFDSAPDSCENEHNAESNTLQFSTPKIDCGNDFFLNFDDDGSADM